MAVYPYTTQRWQRVRRQKLQVNPLCESCLQRGSIEPATVVDHRVPIADGGDPFPPLDQLASLCVRCHNAKTRAEQAGEKNWFVKGCDVFGYPLDPNHPWNRERSRRKCSR
jgi:5-methylcytosine-specific restriction endonuclease McrA